MRRFEYDLAQLLLREGRKVGLLPADLLAANDRPAASGTSPTMLAAPPDDNRLSIVLDGFLLGVVQRTSDSARLGFYRLNLLDATGRKTYSYPTAWRPGATPQTSTVVTDIMSRRGNSLLALYQQADSLTMKRMLQPSKNKPGKMLEAAQAQAGKAQTYGNPLTSRLRDQSAAGQQQLYKLFERYLSELEPFAKLTDQQSNTLEKLVAVQVIGQKDPAPVRGTQAKPTFDTEYGRLPEKTKPHLEASAALQQLLAAQRDNLALQALFSKGSAGDTQAQWRADSMLASQASASRQALAALLKPALLAPPTQRQDTIARFLQLAARMLTPDTTLRANIRRALTSPVAVLLGRGAPLPPAPAGEMLNLLYVGQLLLPTQPVRRLARLYVHDRGTSAAAANRARYVVCLQYSATDGTYEDIGSNLAECQPPTGYIGVSVEMANLERSVFVSQLYNALAAKMKALTEAATEQAAVPARQALIAQQVIPDLPLDLTVSTLTLQGTLSESLAQHSLRESLRDFFDDFIRSQTQLAATPRAGMVLLGQRIRVYSFRAADKAKQQATDTVDYYQGAETKTDYDYIRKYNDATLFEVDSVGLEVEDGSAVGIKAYGRYGRHQVLFETYTPLDLSSDYELHKRWYRVRMYAQSSLLPLSEEEHSLYIWLDELLRYYPMLLARTSDRSPANQVYVFHPQDPLDKRVLYKDPTSKLLQARVFSDLVGFSGDRPNGLVQVEVSKKFTLFNHATAPASIAAISQISFFNYIHPQFTISKIEATNRYLKYQRDTTGIKRNPAIATSRIVRTIDLLRYANLRVGASQNIGVIRVPAMKSIFALDFNAYLGRVAVHDTISLVKTRDSTLTTILYGPQLVWHVRPDSRFGAQFRVALSQQKLFSSNTPTGPGNKYSVTEIRQEAGAGVGDRGHTVAGYLFKTGSYTIMQYEMMLWASVAENSELFFRTQFSHLRYETTQTYFQVQIGYQFDVFTNRRTAVMPTGLVPAN